MMKASYCSLVFLLFGTLLSDPLSAESWFELSPVTGDRPEPRRNASSIYDPVGHRMIVFGGQTVSGDVNDVWAFDLGAATWTEITPVSGPQPAGRFTQNAIYDPLGRQMIVWSGQGTGSFFNDVWSFDLVAHSWSQYTPPLPLPNIRYGTAAVFDPVARDLVTFAGFTDMGRFDDTWRFAVDGVQWTDVSPAVGSPIKRCLHSASYDILNRRMLMYGGITGPGPLDDMWVFDLTADTWTDLTPASRPTGRYFTAHVYDSTRHRALIFGGTLVAGSTDEVWAFDVSDESWTELQPSGGSPDPRFGATAIYVVTEDRMVAFGGSGTGLYNDIWSLNLAPVGGIVFPWQIVADGSSFQWAVPTNIEYVRGDLDLVGSYAVDLQGTEIHSTAFSDASTPSTGAGFFYLVKFPGDDASWQTTPGAESQRDLLLP